MKKVILIILVAFLLSPLISITAQPGNNAPEFQKQRMKEMLNLSEKQEEVIENLRFEHQETMIEMKAELEKHRLSVKKLMKNGEMLPDNLIDKTDEGLALHSKMKKLQTQHWIDIYNVLDESQKSIWAENFGRGKEQFGQEHRMHNRRLGQKHRPGMHDRMLKHNRFN